MPRLSAGVLIIIIEVIINLQGGRMNRRAVFAAAALFAGCLSVVYLAAGGVSTGDDVTKKNGGDAMADNNQDRLDVAVLAGGCFWCVEAVYERIEGVHSAVSGYTGGSLANPTYRQVGMGNTGHAEAVRIEFDPAVITYRNIVDFFWRSHDPTTLNRQGGDVGTQYRSAIFYANDEQRRIAEESLAAAQSAYEGKIVTEIEPLGEFYVAEDYHQDYFDLNPTAGYCQYVIAPKLEKLGLPGQTF